MKRLLLPGTSFLNQRIRVHRVVHTLILLLHQYIGKFCVSPIAFASEHFATNTKCTETTAWMVNENRIANRLTSQANRIPVHLLTCYTSLQRVTCWTPLSVHWVAHQGRISAFLTSYTASCSHPHCTTGSKSVCWPAVCHSTFPGRKAVTTLCLQLEIRDSNATTWECKAETRRMNFVFTPLDLCQSGNILCKSEPLQESRGENIQTP